MGSSAYQKQWRAKNPGKQAEYQRRWRAKNPDTKSDATMDWAKRHPARVKAIDARCRTKNREKRRKSVWKANRYPMPTRPRPDACELCGGINANGKALSLDHCHLTHIFRGWLCNKCNTGLGKLGDSIEGLETALVYLRAVYGR